MPWEPDYEPKICKMWENKTKKKRCSDLPLHMKVRKSCFKTKKIELNHSNMKYFIGDSIGQDQEHEGTFSTLSISNFYQAS